MARNPFGVPHHRQKVTGRQTLARTVSDSYFFRQQKRVCDGSAELVSMLGFGAPMNSAVSLDLVCDSVDFAGWAVIEQAIDLLVEDKLTDQPSAIL